MHSLQRLSLGSLFLYRQTCYGLSLYGQSLPGDGSSLLTQPASFLQSACPLQGGFFNFSHLEQ